MKVWCLIDNVANRLIGIYTSLELAEIAQVEFSAVTNESAGEETTEIVETPLDESLIG